ncbi:MULTISPECIES: hypothetical protein [Streptomyces]|uniref:hypothetical protein n=1 Tax=Streptomyces lycopersici TaxID=2974589 RepID=UPI0021CF90CF|nr:hypothetical protein [Streptomyces sp. NEAU-383]
MVADIWHLMHNLAEAAERIVSRHVRNCARLSRFQSIHSPVQSLPNVNSTSMASPVRWCPGPASGISGFTNALIYLHLRWMEGCTPMLPPWPARSSSWATAVTSILSAVMRRPEHLTDTERKLLTDLCKRCPALASTTEYGRRLAALLRDRRYEHLAFEVWLADVRLDAPRELRTFGRGMRRDEAAISALVKRQMYGRANFNLLRRRILLSPQPTHEPPNQRQSPESEPEPPLTFHRRRVW